jgi:hypothetical protein
MIVKTEPFETHDKPVGHCPKCKGPNWQATTQSLLQWLLHIYCSDCGHVWEEPKEEY